MEQAPTAATRLTGSTVYNGGVGDLNRCNGIRIYGEYLYVITDAYPYVVHCLNGEVSADAGRAAPRVGLDRGAGNRPELAHAATALGVTVSKLKAAPGPPPPDIAGAAASLGVKFEVLRELLSRP